MVHFRRPWAGELKVPNAFLVPEFNSVTISKKGNDDLSILPPPHVSYRNGREWRRKKRNHLPEQILIWNSRTVSSPLTSWPGTHSQHKAPRYLLTQGPSSSLTYFPPQCPPHRAAQPRMRSSQKQLVSKRYIVPWLHPLATSRILPIPPFQDSHWILVLITCRPESRWESHIDRLRQNEFRHRCAPSRGRVELTNNRCNTPFNWFSYRVVLCNQASDGYDRAVLTGPDRFLGKSICRGCLATAGAKT